MAGLREWLARLWATFRPHADDEDIERELRLHVEMAAENGRRRDGSEDPVRLARVRAGGITQALEAIRDQRGLPGLETLGRDVRFGVRMLARNPGFATVAILTLALGIGANSAIFSVINAVLIRPMPYPDPDRLVVLATSSPQGMDYVASDAKFNLWRRQTDILQVVAGRRSGVVNLTGIDVPEQIQASWVTADYFRLFGLPAAEGRTFVSGDDSVAANRVAVLSHALWRHAFGADRTIIGKKVLLSGLSYEVVGVLAPGVETIGPQPVDVWLPLVVDPVSAEQVSYFAAEARLRPDVTPTAANLQLARAADEYRRTFPNGMAMGPQATFRAQPIRGALVGEVRTSLYVLLGAVMCVLLIACANVANLLLARGADRHQEMTLRRALGASSGRLRHQMLTESLVLGIAGGTLGLIFGMAGIRAFLALVPVNIPLVGVGVTTIVLDWRVAGMTAAIALGAGLVFGMIPSHRSGDGDLLTTLKSPTPQDTRPAVWKTAGSGLVVAEISLAVVLLVSAILLIRSFITLRSVDPGIDAHNVFTLRMSLSDPRFEKTSAVAQLIDDAVRRIEALPGVAAAAFSAYVPIEGGAVLPYIVDGRPLQGPFHGFGPWTSISPGYFAILKIPLLRGRIFTEDDGAGRPGVVIINEAMAKQGWPSGDPLSDRISIGKGASPDFDEPPRQIVGIVADVHDGPLNRPPRPSMYVPAAQLTDKLNARIVRGRIAWIVRTTSTPTTLATSIQQQLGRASAGVPIARMRTMDDVVAESTQNANFNMLLLVTFGLIALVLAGIGVYGVLAYSVRRRQREFGIRAALGANARDLQRLVVLRGFRLIAIGLAIGLAASLALGRVIGSFLFQVKARDPVTFVLVPLLVGVVALLAVSIPALRASRTGVMSLLRSE